MGIAQVKIYTVEMFKRATYFASMPFATFKHWRLVEGANAETYITHTHSHRHLLDTQSIKKCNFPFDFLIEIANTHAQLNIEYSQSTHAHTAYALFACIRTVFLFSWPTSCLSFSFLFFFLLFCCCCSYRLSFTIRACPSH